MELPLLKIKLIDFLQDADAQQKSLDLKIEALIDPKSGQDMLIECVDDGNAPIAVGKPNWNAFVNRLYSVYAKSSRVTLSFSNLKLTYLQAEMLAGFISSGQKSLELRFGLLDISQAGIKRLCDGIAARPATLASLKLHRCTAIFCSWMQELMQIGQSGRFERLEIRDAQIDDGGINNLCALIKLNKLSTLKLRNLTSGNSKMPVKILEALQGADKVKVLQMHSMGLTKKCLKPFESLLKKRRLARVDFRENAGLVWKHSDGDTKKEYLLNSFLLHDQKK